jgi:hypothetical protein
MDTSLARCFDAAFPPSMAPPECRAVLGYIGGEHAAHPWTAGEWDRFGHLIQFPAFVPDMAKNPVAQAAEAVDLAAELGWREHRAIICDTETAVDPSWWRLWSAEITRQRFVPVDYGSLSFVVHNDAEIIWAARWNLRSARPARARPPAGTASPRSRPARRSGPTSTPPTSRSPAPWSTSRCCIPSCCGSAAAAHAGPSS